MSSSLRSAGRNTHIRTVAVALVAAIIVASLGIYSRIATQEASVAAVKADRLVVKAGKPAALTDSTSASTR
jgi:hypothetical protein